MISSIIDAVLLSALVATSISVILMYRRLQRFDALQSEAAKAFVQSAQALERARGALDALQEGGGELAVSLAARMNEARLIINDLERESAARQPGNRPAPTARYEMDQERVHSAQAHSHDGDGLQSTLSREIEAAWGDRFSGLRAAAESKEAVRHAVEAHTHTPALTQNVPAVLLRAMTEHSPRHA